jgi:hypothetical protein
MPGAVKVSVSMRPAILSLALLLGTVAPTAPASARYLHLTDAQRAAEREGATAVRAGAITSYQVTGCRHTRSKRLVTCDLLWHFTGDPSGLDAFSWYIDVRWRHHQLRSCYRYVMVADGGCSTRQDDQADRVDPETSD